MKISLISFGNVNNNNKNKKIAEAIQKECLVKRFVPVNTPDDEVVAWVTQENCMYPITAGQVRNGALKIIAEKQALKEYGKNNREN